jgi:hypothetical protein
MLINQQNLATLNAYYRTHILPGNDPNATYKDFIASKLHRGEVYVIIAIIGVIIASVGYSICYSSGLPFWGFEHVATITHMCGWTIGIIGGGGFMSFLYGRLMQVEDMVQNVFTN